MPSTYSKWPAAPNTSSNSVMSQSPNTQQIRGYVTSGPNSPAYIPSYPLFNHFPFDQTSIHPHSLTTILQQ